MDNIGASVPRSLSMQDIGPTSPTEIVGAIISSWRPGFLARTLLWQSQPRAQERNPFAAAVAALKAQFMNYESIIGALHTKIEELEYDNRLLILDNQAYEHEVSQLHADVSDAVCDKILLERAAREEKDLVYLLKINAKQDQAKIKELTSDLENARKFISYMVDIDLHTISPLRDAANMTIDEHIDAEDALLETITEASQRRGSVWSRIVPAVQGSRAPENYVSAINMTLSTRKDLRHQERASQYWKEKAKLDPAHNNLVTLSSSDLDEILAPAIRQKIFDGDESVLDDLMDMVKPSDSFPSDFYMPPEVKRVVEADTKIFPRRASPPVASKTVSTPTIIEPSSSSITEMLNSVAREQDDVFQAIASIHAADETKFSFISSSSSVSSIYSCSSTASFTTPRALVVEQFTQPETKSTKVSTPPASSASPPLKTSSAFTKQNQPLSVKEVALAPRLALRGVDTNRARSSTTLSTKPKLLVGTHRRTNSEKENINPYRTSKKTNGGLLEVPGSSSRSSTSVDSHSGHLGGAGSRVSAKLLGKRNGVILGENQYIMTLTAPSTPSIDTIPYTNSITSTNQSIAAHTSTTNIKTKPGQQPKTSVDEHRNSLDIALEAVLQAEEITQSSGVNPQALGSLENIQSSMSSSDLGSLKTSEVGEGEEEAQWNEDDDDIDMEIVGNVSADEEKHEEDVVNVATEEVAEIEKPLQVVELRKKGPFEEEDPPDFADVSAIAAQFEAGFRRSQETIDKLIEIRNILDIEFPLPESEGGPEGERPTTSPADESLSASPIVSPSPLEPAARVSDARPATPAPLVSSSAWADADTSSDEICSSPSLGLSERSDLSETPDLQERSGEADSTDVRPVFSIVTSARLVTLSTSTKSTPFTPIQLATNSAKSRSRLPMVSGIARRIGRAVMPVDKVSIRKATEKSTISSPLPIASPARSPPPSKPTSLPISLTPIRSTAVKTPPAPSMIKRLSGGTSPRPSAIPSPSRQKPSTTPISTPVKSNPQKSASAQPDQSSVKTPVAREVTKSEVYADSSNSVDAKASTGRNFLRRISNIPGSASKSRPESQTSSLKPTSVNKPRSNTVGSSLPPTLSTPSLRVLAVPTGRALIASRPEKLDVTSPTTKPRSNTVNSFSTTRKSPLFQSSRNGSSSGSDLELSSPFKSRSQLPVPKKVGKPVASGIGLARPSIASPTISKASGSGAAGRTIKIVTSGKTASVSVRRSSVERNASQDSATPSSPPPTEHVSSFSIKANRRMTNSIKPLIPTWSGSEAPTPAQCRNLFRNSLNMGVR